MSISKLNLARFVNLLLLSSLVPLAAQPCVVPDDGTGTVVLPPAGCGYLSPTDVHMIIDGLPPGTTIELSPIHQNFFCPGGNCGQAGGALGGMREQFQSELTVVLLGTGELTGFSRELTIPIQCETHTGPRTPGDAVQTFGTDMFQLQGQLLGDPDFAQLQVVGGTGFGLPSPGQTTLTRLPSGDFNVDSFFDITYQINFQGAPGGALDGLSGSTQATIRMRSGEPVPPPNPCMVVDDGTGTVSLPPEGCEYLSPDEVHMIIAGLPAGTTIELAPIHRNFICRGGGNPNHCGSPGGNLGGERETFDSELGFAITGTGALAGFSRTINIPIACETHTGPRTPGAPIQCFQTDMFRLDGQIFGDPDFDLLRVTGGTDFGHPSPGVTVLNQMPGGTFNVDSFFDIAYEIEFIGAPGGALDGLSGTTTARIRMRTGDPIKMLHPCVSPPDATGAVNLPVPDCPYLSAAEVHEIINGLPPGTTIRLDPVHQGFICNPPSAHCGQPGGLLGGEVETFDSTLVLKLSGTGALNGFDRLIQLPIAVTTHTGPQDPVVLSQTFPTDMFQLQGQLFGDPDFSTLQISGGTNSGMPSPGQTTLHRLPDGDFVVDSFFDITYQIDFQGTPTGILGGMSGSTQSTIQMQAGDNHPARFFNPFWRNGAPTSIDVRRISEVVGLGSLPKR